MILLSGPSTATFYSHNRQKNKEKKKKKIVYYQEKAKFYKFPLKNIGNVFIMVKSMFEKSSSI